MEYRLTRIANIEKMKYNPEKKQFHVKCSFVGPNPRTNVMEEQKEEMIVEEWFMNDILPKYLVKQCKTAGRNLDGNYHTVPKSKHFRLNDKPNVAVKFFPSVTRTVKDQDYIREEAKKKMDQRLLDKKSKEIYDLEQAMERGEPAPVKEISTKEIWHARTDDGKFFSVEEDVLVQKFGAAYVKKVKESRRGFVDIPAGDNKESHVHRFPNLLSAKAPRIRYRQLDGMDLCVPKALASVLYALGFKRSADLINDFGESNMAGGVVDTLKQVRMKAIECLPSWVWVSEINSLSAIDFRPSRCILLGVIASSDGHTSHAIATHGGYIYDANEEYAIPLCQEGLDYCASTPTKARSFVRFHRVVRLEYRGQQANRQQSMTLKNF